jgi:predicted PurR-regulated permease PerM
MTNGSAAGGLSRLTIGFFIACFVGLLYFLYQLLSPFFSVLIWALVLTVVFSPLYSWILVRLRGKRGTAATITCVLILLLIVLPMLLLGYLVTQQSVSFYQSLHDNPDSLDQVNSKLGEIQTLPAVQRVLNASQKWFGVGEINLQEYYREALSSVSKFLLARGPEFLKNVGAMVLNFLLIFITMFFLFRDGPRLVEVCRSSSPLPEAYESELIQKFQDVSYATLFGSLLSAAANGAGATILFLVLGLPASLFWGAVVAMASLVPIVGSGLVWIPWGVYLLLAGQTTRAIILMAIGMLVIGSVDNVLKPIIIKGRTDMHPLLVFFSVLGGLDAFGFLGILLGPLIVALFISFLNFYRHEFRVSLQETQAKPDPPESTASAPIQS